MRYPGTIVVELLEPVPAGLPRSRARAEIEARIETACARLIAEARAAPAPPPLPAGVPGPAGRQVEPRSVEPGSVGVRPYGDR
jgi:1-acyl-sn-glycerol-3-phosphate acyltransferase